MQKTIYITQCPASTMRPEHPSQPSPFPSIDAAVETFKPMPETKRLKRVVVLDAGGGQRIAVSDYALL